MDGKPRVRQSPAEAGGYQKVWSLTDESLLAGLASGDPEQAAAFVRRFQARVYGLSLAVLGDPEAAEDAAQETFIRAWRYAAAYDPRRGRVLTWLLGIARNVAADTARLRRHVPMDPHAMVGLPIAAPGDDPEERAILSAEARRLGQALPGLPDDQRRALLMAAFQGRTAREIAEAEDIPLGTAKTRIRSAMRKLRSAMDVDRER